MIALIIRIFFIILAGFFNAVMDTLHTNRYSKSIFVKWKIFKNHQQFLDPSVSARNKWKNGDKKQGEKFFGSSTFLVFLTDGWHLAKFLMTLCFAIALCTSVIIFSVYLDWAIYWILFGFSFEMFFRRLWKA